MELVYKVVLSNIMETILVFVLDVMVHVKRVMANIIVKPAILVTRMKGFVIVSVLLELMLINLQRLVRLANLLVFNVLYNHHIAQGVFLIYMHIKDNVHQLVLLVHSLQEINAKYANFLVLIVKIDFHVKNALEDIYYTCRLHA